MEKNKPKHAELSAEAAEFISGLPGSFDHHSSVYRDNFRTVLEAMQTRCPFARSEQYGGFWFATKMATINEIIRNPTVFVSSRGETIPQAPIPDEMIPIHNDPPELYEWRAILNPLFAPHVMKAEAPRIGSEALELMDAFAESRACDFVTDVAQPLSGLATMRLLGFDEKDWPIYAKPLHELNYGNMPQEALKPMMDEMIERMTAEIRKRFRKPGATGLLRYLGEEAKFQGKPITIEEMDAIAFIVLGGGLDTTQSLLGSATVFLGRNPERRQELLDHPERMQSAIEELLRMFPPTQMLVRHAVEDIEVEGRQIEKNERVMMMFTAANYDPDEFTNPNVADFQREPNRHISFGMGPHRCIGSHLARIEITAALEALLSRAPNYRLKEAEIRLSNDIATIYGYQNVPIEW